MIFSIESLLAAWANTWAREKGCKGYPTLQSFAREMERDSYPNTRPDDSTCLEIDKQVMKLHDFNLRQYQILMAVYLQRIEHREIWKTLGIGSKTFYLELKAAKSFIAGALIAKEVKIFI